jgi:hypothetical protein
MSVLPNGHSAVVMVAAFVRATFMYECPLARMTSTWTIRLEADTTLASSKASASPGGYAE